MASTGNALESEIVKWLISLIESEKLVAEIGGVDRIREIEASFDQPDNIPAFGFDHLSRRASVRAADAVLESLELLEVVAVDKSVSLTTSEILRPDIVCFNREKRAFVVFEVKRDGLTERQAITELAGYEHELRNLLPFIGNCEVNFVVVSTHWDTLLDHAVANHNTWSGKNCLALKVDASSSQFTLNCHIPQAWQLRGGVGLPEDALQTIDVYLEEKDAADDEDGDEIPPQLITAMNAIARSGDRLGSHGFALLWRDTAGFGSGVWAITLCGIDPIAMHAWCANSGLATELPV